MNETPQQYTQRILGHVQGLDALRVQAATPKKLQKLIAGKSPAQLRKKPAPDKWSVTEILAHLGDAEIVTRVAHSFDPRRAGNPDPGL